MTEGTRMTLKPMRDDPELTALLERAKSHVMTPEERDAQRFSWVLGEMMLSHPEWTREEAVAFVSKAIDPRPYVYIGIDGKATTGRALEDRAIAAEASLAAVTAERDALRGIVRDTLWMARRYADGRRTYAVGMCNDAIAKAAELGLTFEDKPDVPFIARDGDGPDWQPIEARALASEAERDALRKALEKSRRALLPFADAIDNDNGVIGVTLGIRHTADQYEAAYWAESRARALLTKERDA